jgi:hypothetical protein
MVKFIEIDSLTTPDVSGYGDKLHLWIDNVEILSCPCSVCPNPFRPSDSAPWRQAYGWLAPGECLFECMVNNKHGKHFLLADGGILPARAPNVNHGGDCVCSEIEIHRGDTMTWRGSAGCITLPPNIWQSFIDRFEVGDTGAIRIVDATEAVAA